MQRVTISQAIDIAINAERTAEQLYGELQRMFAGAPELADFWQGYASDEARHAEWLAQLKERLSPAELEKPVDDPVMRMLGKLANLQVAQALERVENLEDAYQLVSDLEGGETNTVFQFLLNNFESDDEMRTFLRLHLEKHIARLSIDLPSQYKGIAARKAIMVQPG